jgi:hypothetical protein
MSRNSINITNSSVNGPVLQDADAGDILINESNSKQSYDYKKLASEIQSILNRLSGSHSTTTLPGQMTIAAEAIQYIEKDIPLKQRILSATKAGGGAAIGQFLNHPAASFVIAAFEKWNSQS